MRNDVGLLRNALRHVSVSSTSRGLIMHCRGCKHAEVHPLPGDTCLGCSPADLCNQIWRKGMCIRSNVSAVKDNRLDFAL